MPRTPRHGARVRSQLVRLRPIIRLVLTVGLTAALAAVALPSIAGTPDPAPLSAMTRFYTPPASAGAIVQARDLEQSGRAQEAGLIRAMSSTPQAVWLTGRSPLSVQRTVRQVTDEAARHATVPTLVLYNVPGRDCSSYSAGGADGDAAYRDWVDGIAKGLSGQGRIIVIVEPDGLALLPSDCPWAYPGRDIAAMTAGRIADLRYAGQRLAAVNPSALIYLDAGQSGWRGVGEIARRLDQAGVRDVQGFALNVSNFQPTPQLLQYGGWVSKCLYFAANPADGGWRLGHYDYCASQYGPASPKDFSTWSLSEQWYADNVDGAPGGPPGSADLAHFVIDTSRNGRGAWTSTAGYRDDQTWCNPPGRGLGPRPTARTGSTLADAFLWVKIPGQSDGRCNRGVTGSATDPEWGGRVDPAAGDWFGDQALELARLADPPVR